jgi:hypothetical protein
VLLFDCDRDVPLGAGEGLALSYALARHGRRTAAALAAARGTTFEAAAQDLKLLTHWGVIARRGPASASLAFAS